MFRKNKHQNTEENQTNVEDQETQQTATEWPQEEQIDETQQTPTDWNQDEDTDETYQTPGENQEN